RAGIASSTHSARIQTARQSSLRIGIVLTIRQRCAAGSQSAHTHQATIGRSGASFAVIATVAGSRPGADTFTVIVPASPRFVCTIAMHNPLKALRSEAVMLA